MFGTNDKVHYKIVLTEDKTTFTVVGWGKEWEITELANENSGKLKFLGKGLCIRDVHVI